MVKAIPEKLLLDINEVSALTGFSVGTIYSWVSQKKIPVVRISARCIRFELAALQSWIAQKTEFPWEPTEARAKRTILRS